MEILVQYSDFNSEKAISITEAIYIGNFAIRLLFSDGHQKLVNFKPFLMAAQHPRIKKYLTESRFRHF